MSPPQGTCHFLHIPAELRNSFYEYALTEDRSLRFERRGNDSTLRCYKQPIAQPGGDHDMDAFATSLTDALLEVNQLRFVNKQLYAETRGLTLRYNDLSFENIKDANHFLESCASSHLNRIRALTVHWVGRWSPGLHEAAPVDLIAQFCNAHPQAINRFEIKNLSPNQPAHLTYLALDEVRLRDTQTLLTAMYSEASGVREQFASAAKERTVQKILACPKNIRYFPST